MAIEVTHICDRCGARHTGDSAPLGWHASPAVTFDTPALPTYSPWHIDSAAGLYCSTCMQEVADMINAATQPVVR